MPDHKVKSFSYWRARFNEPYDYTLADLLLSSFENTTVQDRLGVLDEENEEIANHFNFINHKAIYEDFFCANFFGYEKGKIEQIIKEEFDSEEISSTAFKLPMDEQFLKGKLYFVCFGNHLIAAQDMHLKVLHLAKYLNDKFHERCREFPEGQHLTIERTIRRTRREEIRGAKRISLSSPLPARRERLAPTFLESQVQSYSVGDRVWGAIEILTNKSLEDILGQFRQFDTHGIVEEKDIEVTLSLFWNKKRGEKFSDRVDALANAFSYIDEEIDVEIHTNSGILKYDELRMSAKKSVAHLDDMPDNYDIFQKMREWYYTLVEAGDI